MTSPRIVLTLDGHGALALVLPGAEGGERFLPLLSKDLGKTLMRVLRGVADNRNGLGLDGSPTLSQAECWVRHSVFRDFRCAHCVAELRAANAIAQNRQRLQRGLRQLSAEGASVRRCEPGESGLPPRAPKAQRQALPIATTKRTAAQLGL